ncbi:MAG: hypothetical protein KDC46_14765 [Thermoleophilia bacterium]|nr:hypothetical protein [Thermoleophilia bacterium]
MSIESLLVPLGIALFAIPAIDLFRELFQPGGRGGIGHLVARIVWRVLRAPARRSPLIASLTGPIILLLTLAAWLGLSVLGWALMLTPAMNGSAFVGHEAGGAFVDALYLSLVTISTLGFGDVVPDADWARLIVPLEALFGLGVAAGSISWLFNVQTVLSHRSTLATRIAMLEAAEGGTPDTLPIEQLDRSEALVMDLASHLASVHADLVHVPISYWFKTGEDRHSLPEQLAWLVHLADRCTVARDPIVRLHGGVLRRQLDGTLRDVAHEFLHLPRDTPSGEVLAAWRRDHSIAGA